MIRCNLSILLAEQRLKITKVSNDTGISRTTLTALSNNHSQGVQFDTLNVLCQYLRVTPNELISFLPIDVELIGVEMHGSTVTAIFNAKDKLREYAESIDGVMLFENRSGRAFITFDLIPRDGQGVNAKTDLIYLLLQLPRTFLTDIEAQITDRVLKARNDVSELSYTWNTEAP